MGAPGYTEFCRNGHIVKDVPHHYIDYREIGECPYCGSIVFTTVFEWLDKDYWGDKVLVPVEPLYYKWYEVNNDWFRGERKVAAYDMSMITDWKERQLNNKGE